MDMVNFLVTEQETRLLADLDDIGFGEIPAYWCQSEEPKRMVRVDRRVKDALFALRSIQGPAKIMVHESRPIMIEYESTAPATGCRCIRKIKFT